MGDKNEIAAYVRIDIAERWDYARRFKVTVSTPTSEILLERLKTYLPDLGIPSAQKLSLTELLDTFFDFRKTEASDTKDWFLYEVKESGPPKDDRILRAINIVRKKEGKQPLTWTHFTLFVACKTEKTKTRDVEQAIQDWLDKLMPPRNGEFGTWVTATPVKLLPDERIRRGKSIPIPRREFERLLLKKTRKTN